MRLSQFLSCLLFCTCLPAFCLSDESETQQAPTAEQLKFVRSKVLPLLESRCFECHRDGKELKGGLHLGSRKSMLKGGDSGPSIVPGKPDESLIVEAIRYEGFEMPPRSKMPTAEVDIIVRWIEDGAIWPADLDTDPIADSRPEFPLEQRRKSHWAWQQIESPNVPDVHDADWPRNQIDAFVLHKLEAAKLNPAQDADRYTLIRRLYFDLIGLPPTPAQVTAFTTNPATDDVAIAKVVDELLASPQFGERWARHWLDLVRYAETLGHEFDYPLHNAWRYRDYVIKAFNQDVPYDLFLKEHIAGDLLTTPRRHPVERYNESIIGTGFWFLCEDKHAPVDVKGEEAAKVDNQLDVFSKSFLGMTVACARCHDHKFDAISTQDYYALSGFLQSSRRQTAWLDPHQKIAERIKTLKSVRTKVTQQVTTTARSLKDDLTRYTMAAMDVVTQGVESPEAAATKHNCNPQVLANWITALQLKPNTGTERLLSFPASVLQGAQKPETAIANWRRTATATSATDDTTVFQNLNSGLPEGWFALGQAFDGVSPESAPGLEWRKDGVVQNLSDGVSSATLSKELRGTLMSPEFELEHPEILVRVAGQGTRMRLVIDGYIMYEYNGLLFGGMKQNIDTDGEFRWLRFAGDTHRYQGHRMHIEFLDEGNGWFNVSEVRFANKRGATPRGEPVLEINATFAKSLPENTDNVAVAVARWAEVVTANTQTQTAAQLALGFADDAAEKYATVIDAWSAAAAGLPAPVPVIAMTEGTEEDEFIFIRGSHRNRGEIAPRQILTALQNGQDHLPIEHGSGRLQLAEKLVAPDNPLVARVAVNRMWHHLFGRGIVESTDNFGVLGQKPTHPELLDYLATSFRENGWSMKAVIKEMLLSRTYRMSSDRSADADSADPTNALWHRAKIRRLQGEAVRDAILTVSGRLDRKQFGAPVPVHLTAFMQGRGRPGKNGALDGEGRRSIYIAVNRNFLSPFMLAFDVPAPVSTTGKRTVSNVPAQALIMLNNQFVNQQARVWAEKLLAAQPTDNRELLSNAWIELFNRPATNDDLKPLLAFADSTDNSQLLDLNTLTEICHVLLNSKEFLFLN